MGWYIPQSALANFGREIQTIHLVGVMKIDVRFPLFNWWDFDGTTSVAFVNWRTSSRWWHRSRRSRGEGVSLRCQVCVVRRLLWKGRWCRWKRRCRLGPRGARWERWGHWWWRRYSRWMPKGTRGRHCIMHRATKRRYRLMPCMVRSSRCARAIRLCRRDSIRILAKLRDQVLGRHDVDSSHGMLGQG